MSKERQRVWVPETCMKKPEEVKQEIYIPLPGGRFAGIVEVELIEAATGRVKEYYKFPNIILTAGMDGMFAIISNNKFSDMITNLVVGTGSAAVTPSDLKLDEPVGSTTSNGGFGDTTGYVTGTTPHGPFALGDPYHFIRRVRLFTESEVNFPDLSELGWRNVVSSPEFQFTRALFKDSSGTPITIAKTSADQLKITYEMRMYPPTFHFSGSFVMADSEVSHSWTGSAVDIDDVGTGTGWGFSAGGFGVQGFFFGFGNFAQEFAGRDTQPFASASVPFNPTGTTSEWGWSGNQDNAGSSFFSRSFFAPQSGTFSVTKEAAWGAPLANFASGGIQAIAIDYSKSTFVFGIYITPSIKKTDVQKLKFIWTMTATASVTSST